MFYAIIVPLAWVIWHLGFAIKVVGRENLPKDGRGFVLAPNHLSAIDPVFVVLARFWGKKMLVMAKEEVMHVNPFFTWFFHQVGVFGVTRGRGDTTAVEDAIEKVRAGQGLLIFPEGTRSKTGEPGKLKSGAFVIASAAGVDMIPCRIIYRHGHMRLFSRVRVCFGEPIPAETLYLGEHKSAAKLRENKQQLLDAWQKLYDENRFE
ncbi:lysophospholipid acyltransferase family protein [Allofournierella sp.]|uniref:lysophospholipid acyltransferase family protein n=1 Tax=Allofournierella sp. TaxID=1940256 RepID=UPI002E798074|nr:lysophospholipid acyltransferase family protein [Fournierella sp.]MEE0756070.1 lysophospholipid acyltransferase family protein [Fournierella sp.]